MHGRWCPGDARDVVVLPDSLTLGPCHIDPGIHGGLRQEFWLSFEHLIFALCARKPPRSRESHRDELAREIHTSGQLIAALEGFADSRPIVLWTSPNPGDRVAFWWMLDALGRGGIAPARCWVADSREPEDGPDALRSYGAQLPEKILGAWARLGPLTPARVRQGASLWAKYTSPSPASLERLRRARTTDAVDRRVLAELFRWMLPRATDAFRAPLRLSEFDQFLLGHLDEHNWFRPMDVLANPPRESGTRQLMAWLGDRVFLQRFAAWGCHRPDEPSLVSRPLPDGANAGTSVAYRLTPKGRRIVDVGLDDPEDAPEFPIGGHRAYRGTPLWARHIAGNAWRVNRWK